MPCPYDLTEPLPPGATARLQLKACWEDYRKYSQHLWGFAEEVIRNAPDLPESHEEFEAALQAGGRTWSQAADIRTHLEHGAAELGVEVTEPEGLWGDWVEEVPELKPTKPRVDSPPGPLASQEAVISLTILASKRPNYSLSELLREVTATAGVPLEGLTDSALVGAADALTAETLKHGAAAAPTANEKAVKAGSAA